MSRFSKIINQLEELNEQETQNYQDELKNSSKVFAIAAHLYERLDQLAKPKAAKPKPALPPKKITKEFLVKTFGNYQKTYQAYKQAYGIKCKTQGWKHLLPLIQNLDVPTEETRTTEERLNVLEEKVDLILEILLKTTQQT